MDLMLHVRLRRISGGVDILVLLEMVLLSRCQLLLVNW